MSGPGGGRRGRRRSGGMGPRHRGPILAGALAERERALIKAAFAEGSPPGVVALPALGGQPLAEWAFGGAGFAAGSRSYVAGAPAVVGALVEREGAFGAAAISGRAERSYNPLMVTTDPTPLYDALSGLLAQRSDLRLAILFGSRAEGRARPDSDIDLAVAAAGPLDTKLKMDLIEAVAERCGSPVDLIDLRTVGEPLLGRILQRGRKLLVRDTRLLGELYKRHLFDSADFLPYRRRILEERRKAWTGS